jgi:hypothetical protein
MICTRPYPWNNSKASPSRSLFSWNSFCRKTPGRRFQNLAELLKMIPTITGAIDARRRIARQSLQKTSSAASRVGTRKAPPRLAPKKIPIARLPVTGSDVFGRDEDIVFLDRAWANKDINVVTLGV